VRTRSQPRWLDLPHLPILQPPVTANTTNCQNSGRSAWGGTDGYGWLERVENVMKNVDKWCVIRDQSLTMEKSWVMMIDRTDKEVKGTRRVGGNLFHKWGAAHRKERFVILRLESTDGWRTMTNVDDRVDWEGWSVLRSRR